MSLCCNAHQIDVIVAVCAYTVLILGTWRVDAVVKPFKLLAVFVHEGCHACACLATGGRVDGVEVNINEGGVTRYRGGWRLCVTPAGYLGGALWAALCTAVLDYRWGMFCVAASLGLALLATLLSLLWTKRNDDRATTGMLSVFFLGICVFLAWASLEGGTVRLVAQYVLLFVTTYVSVFSVYDIYDDCVRRYVNDAQTKSDAVVCAQLCPICPARGWGVVWLVISMGFWAGGVCYLVLHVGGHLKP